jgi:molybdopterin-guanine dinucleotide biosynthesis protein A
MTEPPGPTRGAIVLTGGTAVRMDGTDKASLELQGVTLLERALAATATAAEVVVVGEPVDVSRPVTWAREEPAGGGPAAGLLAGLDRFRHQPDVVAVLAVDMPRVTPGTFARLEAALEADVALAPDPAVQVAPAVGEPYDGALLVDGDGRRQPLCAVYRVDALRRVRPVDPEDEQGLSMHRLISGLRLHDVPAVPGESVDVDTWRDLLWLRENSYPDERPLDR